ncbi:MAG TPA: phenylalanine--tRNA ligase subunit beta [Spirochaetia bacterium]|nr:phenylalanine--tRNA ligase subunit beta [Spirochaetia bacterium]
MPKIELFQKTLFDYMGTTMPDDELESLLEAAKGEIDEPVDAEGIMKIELNDTNRPDLWSTAGLGRALRIYLGGEIPTYDFLSRGEDVRNAAERRVIVDAGLKEYRPYIAAFAVSGKPIDEPALKDLIQSQEKLCNNFGQRRKSIAMGVYRTSLMTFPVHYKAVDPEATRFVPLGEEREMNLREIIADHPKGQEFGPIVADFPTMPFLVDAKHEVLSFPPVINSARVGAVEVGDEELFVELTGTDLESLLLACSIIACDLADAGHTIHPVAVEYPYDTPLGRVVVTPYYFQEPVIAELPPIRKLLGEAISADDAVIALRAMGVRTEMGEAAGVEAITAFPPEYRNDFLHAVDVAEDVIIGRGMKSFAPEMPHDFTIGRLTPGEQFNRKVIGTMVGMGFLEMIFPYMGSGRDFVEKLRPVAVDGGPDAAAWDGPDQRVVKLSNPMSENYEYVRHSSLPFLLNAESVSAHAAYPHQIFEVGKVARFDAEDNHGVRTVDALCFVGADADANFTRVAGQVSVLFYYLSREYEVAEVDDPRFIPGRVAEVRVGGRAVGVFGELHPQVLENFGITVPATACDLDLNLVHES